MNIFVTDNCPYESAKNLCDKHVNKMWIETAQILSAVIDHRVPMHKGPLRLANQTVSEVCGLPQYPKAHVKHPCTIWAMESQMNAQWLTKHMHGIEQEFRLRYPRTEHKLQGTYKQYVLQLEQCEFDKVEMTPFAQAMPDLYKADDAVVAYRTYYLMDKTFASWKKETPIWFDECKTEVLRLVRGFTTNYEATPFH